jgi:hypothetical protein
MPEEPLALPLALVVGINRYPFLPADPQGKPKHLESPARGAEEIAILLHTYGKFNVTKFPSKRDAYKVDPHPSKPWRKSDLEREIRNLFNPPGGPPPKKALLFFAGHGLLVNCSFVKDLFWLAIVI